MKNYIRIESYRNDEQKTVSTFLLTDNVTGYISEACETRLFFKSSNPFSFARLHLEAFEFERLMRSKATFTKNVQGTTFIYSSLEL